MARLELQGTSVSPGIGVGRTVLCMAGSDTVPVRHIRATQVDAEIERFEMARLATVDQLASIQRTTAKELGQQDASIYSAMATVLQDPDARRQVHEAVQSEQLAAESAIESLLERFELLFRSMEGLHSRDWSADLRDPWRAVQRTLLEEDTVTGLARPGAIVLVAQELTPTLMTRFPRERLAGVLTERGGQFSHGAVIARSFGIPTVVGLRGITDLAREGEGVVVYASQATALLGAVRREFAQAKLRAGQQEELRDRLRKMAARPGRTADGHPVAICANIESPQDLDTIPIDSIEGVGLFRTEFVYMDRPSFPSESEQASVYIDVVRRMPGRPVVFRTIDIGGDKRLRYFKTPDEENPVLGWRGIRIVLEWPDLLLAQLGALLLARRHGDVRVLLPMVTTLDEVLDVRERFFQLKADLGPEASEDLPVGAMIEVPAAAMALREIAEVVDFVSVGTNDLVQYLMAADRDNPWVSRLYQPYHPAHLRLLLHIGEICKDVGTPLSVCGEMAGEPAGALFLVGAGFESLSMAGSCVLEVKALLRVVRLQELQAMAREAADQATAAQAREVVDRLLSECWTRVEGLNDPLSP